MECAPGMGEKTKCMGQRPLLLSRGGLKNERRKILHHPEHRAFQAATYDACSNIII
jgi:hypothetical protein